MRMSLKKLTAFTRLTSFANGDSVLHFNLYLYLLVFLLIDVLGTIFGYGTVNILKEQFGMKTFKAGQTA